MPIRIKPYYDEACIVISFDPEIAPLDMVRDIRAALKQVSNAVSAPGRSIYRIYDFTGIDIQEMHMVMLVAEEIRRKAKSRDMGCCVVIDNRKLREEMADFLRIYPNCAIELFTTVTKAVDSVQQKLEAIS
jgi:hypothetical protein